MESMPYMALDVLSEKGNERIPRRYRHEAESFAWVLIYIYGTTHEHEGKVTTAVHYPFDAWLYGYQTSCFRQKFTYKTTVQEYLVVHAHTRPLLAGLHNIWCNLDSKPKDF